MSFGRYNPRTRYLARDRKRTNAVLLSVILVTLIAVLSFWLGRQHASYQINSLTKENEEARTQINILQDEITTVRAEAQTATQRYEQLMAQYTKDLPEDGPMRAVVELVRKQIESGMSAERLEFVLRSARPPRNCTDPASRRFVIKTPAYNGPQSIASFGEGVVTITGTGASAKNKEGQPESWYDPTQAVTINFKTTDGLNETKSGVLPIQYSLIAKGREYRFTLSEGEKSFVKATFDSCEYP